MFDLWVKKYDIAGKQVLSENKFSFALSVDPPEGSLVRKNLLWAQ